MPRGNVASISARLSEISELDQLKALINARFGSIAAWSRSHGWAPEHVHMTFAGGRPGSNVREALVEDFGLTREAIDRAIDDGAVPA